MLPSNISNIFSLIKVQMWNIENISNLSKLEAIWITIYILSYLYSTCKLEYIITIK